MGADDCLPLTELLHHTERITRSGGVHQIFLSVPSRKTLHCALCDHSSLRWLVKMKEPEGQLARWLEKLAEYDFRVVHRPGRHHHNADVMSQRPCRPTSPCNMTDPAEGNGKIHHQGVQCNLELHGDVTSPEFRVVGVGALGFKTDHSKLSPKQI